MRVLRNIAGKLIHHKRVLAAALPVLLLGFVGLAFWRASRAIETSEGQVAKEGQFPFTTVRLDKRVPAGYEALNTPATYKDVIKFQGKLYLCGPAGLFSFTGDGKPAESYRVGQELPPAPLIQMAQGMASDSTQPELWITTAGEGVLAFDGKVFRQIRPKSALHRSLTAVLPLSTGRVLLGTERAGVLVYDGKQLAPFHSSLVGFRVTALAGTESDIWVGTLDRGLLHWHAGQVETFDEGAVLPDKQVLSLASEGDSVFAGTALGIAEFRGGRFYRRLGDGLFAQSMLASTDNLKVGTLQDGVFGIPLQAQKPRPMRSSAEAIESPVDRLAEIDGQQYALTGQGLYELEKNGGWRPVLLRDASLLTDRNISALSVDKAGRIWVGYFDKGLDVLEIGAPRARHTEDDQVFCVNRIVQDEARGITLVATANGLVLFDRAGQKRQVIGRADGLIANHVTDVVVTPSGMIAATPAGLTFVDPGGLRSLYAFHGLVNNHAYALGASSGKLLVGTLGGMSILESGIVKASYTTSNSGLKQNWITAIVPVGEDWFIGTYGAGVVQFTRDGTWQTFPTLPAGIEVNPNAMAVSNNRVFAGTLGNGLLVYDRGAARWSIISAGLPSANVTAIAVNGGFVYVGTDNGLIRMEEGRL